MSVLGCIQLFCDSSQIFLSARLQLLYPFHKTLLNIDDSIRRKLILNGEDVVAYFHARCHKSIMCEITITFSGSAIRYGYRSGVWTSAGGKQ